MTPQAESAQIQASSSHFSDFSDRFNPILVKEVRQALRGRAFRVGFGLCILLVATCCLAMLLGMTDAGAIPQSDIRTFFGFILSGLYLGVFGVVPALSFVSVGAEWEENTRDLLLLSNLRGRHIITGKIASAVVQILLITSGLVPFLGAGFLLGGIDLSGLLCAILFAVLGGIATVMFAVFLSSVTDARFGRVVAFILLTNTSLFLGITLFAVTFSWLEGSPTVWSDLIPAVIIVAYSAGFFAIAAMALNSHPMENSSTALRAWTTGCLVVTGALLLYQYLAGYTGSFNANLYGPIALMCLALPLAGFVTEREELGPLVKKRVPPNPGISLFLSAFLPGGGRGFVLLLGVVSSLTAFVFALEFFATGSLSYDSRDFPIMAAYLVIYLGIPSAIGARFSSVYRNRMRVRASIPLFAIALFLFPSLFALFIGDSWGFIAGGGDRSPVYHAANPVFMLDMANRVTAFDYISLIGLALLAIAINAPRCFKALSEVIEASRDRRASAEPGKP